MRGEPIERSESHFVSWAEGGVEDEKDTCTRWQHTMLSTIVRSQFLIAYGLWTHNIIHDGRIIFKRNEKMIETETEVEAEKEKTM